jgi:hypothetical protein
MIEAIAIIIVIIILLIIVYEKGWFNSILPSNMKKKSNFVGVYGRSANMQGCFTCSDPECKWPLFNRCTWA